MLQRKVYVNDREIGKAHTRHEAERLLFEFADELFSPAAKMEEFNRADDRKRIRSNAFLLAMGEHDPAHWKRTLQNSDEVGDTFKFLFRRAGRQDSAI